VSASAPSPTAELDALCRASLDSFHGRLRLLFWALDPPCSDPADVAACPHGLTTILSYSNGFVLRVCHPCGLVAVARAGGAGTGGGGDGG
jgi:hypothetical protein